MIDFVASLTFSTVGGLYSISNKVLPTWSTVACPHASLFSVEPGITLWLCVCEIMHMSARTHNSGS